jgi:tetratricopeptide (TPR) repeat protein
VLELEAAVQQEPRDASAWIALGLKQQENEREDAAIRALAKATELDPDARGAYLALAVSYTNEGREESAHAALERWIELGPAADLPMSQTPGESSQERKARIIDSLIHIARMSPDDLDADVQVALGVLFNSSEVCRSGCRGCGSASHGHGGAHRSRRMQPLVTLRDLARAGARRPVRRSPETEPKSESESV